jgi:hypothetical protein
MKLAAYRDSFVWWHAALIAIVALALYARLVPGERTIDDAYITFRYARNLLAGEGFVYNPGERVQGTTTPLYTLLLAGEKGILKRASLPMLALVTNALADAASVALLAWLGRRALGAPWLGLVAGLLWALSPMSVTFGIGGMETSVYVLLLLLTVASYAAGRSRWSAFCCALATLTRPDALLLAVPLFAHMVWERIRRRPWNAAGMETRPTGASKGSMRLPTWPFRGRFQRGIGMPLLRSRRQTESESWEGHPHAPISRSRRQTESESWEGHPHAPVRSLPWQEVTIYLLTLAPWLLFATLYFGSPLAHSVVAKSAAYRLEPYSALVRLIQHYATPFFEHETLGTGWVAVGAVSYLFLSLLGGLAMVRRADQSVGGRLLPLVVYPWLYFFAFSLYNPLLFRWYLAPVLPMYTLCILYGARRLVRDLTRAFRRPAAAQRGARIVEGLLALAAVGMLLNAWTLHPDHGPDRPAPKMAWFKLELLYRQVTLELLADQPVTPETRIAAGDIGAIGYYSGARILDTVGLISPEAVGYYPLPDEAYATAYAVSTDLIVDERPDYLILLEVYARNTLQRSEAFAAEYEVYRRWPTDIYGSDGLLVYRRKRE